MAKGIAKGLADSDGVVFQTIPSGTYNARVTKVEDTQSGSTSKHPGTPMVKIAFRLISDDEAIDGQQVFTQQMLPGASWMTEEDNRKQVASVKRMYIALGLECNEDEYDTDDWMGEECQVVVTEKEYNGKMVNNISDVLPV